MAIWWLQICGQVSRDHSAKIRKFDFKQKLVFFITEGGSKDDSDNGELELAIWDLLRDERKNKPQKTVVLLLLLPEVMMN